MMRLRYSFNRNSNTKGSERHHRGLKPNRRIHSQMWQLGSLLIYTFMNAREIFSGHAFIRSISSVGEVKQLTHKAAIDHYIAEEYFCFDFLGLETCVRMRELKMPNKQTLTLREVTPPVFFIFLFSIYTMPSGELCLTNDYTQTDYFRLMKK